jgi:hypothetical protein
MPLFGNITRLQFELGDVDGSNCAVEQHQDQLVRLAVSTATQANLGVALGGVAHHAEHVRYPVCTLLV